jgi:hypothetical protein
MLTICAYCKRETKDGQAVGEPIRPEHLESLRFRNLPDCGVSDGICYDCREIEREKLAEYRKEKQCGGEHTTTN